MQEIPVRRLPNTTAVGGKIHVRLTEGRFQNLRRMITGPLLCLYFALVWVQVNGQPWLLFNFDERRILLFGLNLSWHDLPLLAGFMIAGTCMLFFAAVAWGRVWCGFACPQSIWTWLFIRIENIVEGRAAIRRKDEKKGMTPALLVRRVIKHSLWLTAAFVTALTFSGYFIPIRELFSQLIELRMSYTTIGWLITMTALTYLNAGLVREKVCFHMCPYSRFQGVMFDSDTRTVSYDVERGEPRRGARKSAEEAKGDCVDCDLCVQVCPTGIDIRDGLQYECIDCGACIDACDAVMEKINKPKGLIAFKSENQLDRQPSPLVRPRLLGYATVVLVTFISVGYGFNSRSNMVMEVLRDRNTIAHQNSAGEVCNSYQLKLEAVNPNIEKVSLKVSGPEQLYLIGPTELNLGRDKYYNQIYQLCKRGDLPGPRAEVTFAAQSTLGSVSKQIVFLERTH